MAERAARVRWYPSYCISVGLHPVVRGVRGYHGNHRGDVNAVVLIAVARVETADDFCGEGGFAAAGDAGDADEDTVGREGAGEECCGELQSYSFRMCESVYGDVLCVGRTTCDINEMINGILHFRACISGVCGRIWGRAVYNN